MTGQDNYLGVPRGRSEGHFGGHFGGHFWGHFWRVFWPFFRQKNINKFLGFKKATFGFTFFSGPRAGPPKKPSLSNRRIGTRNTDSHMIPIIFVHSKKRLVHPRDRAQKRRAKIKIFFSKFRRPMVLFSSKIHKKNRLFWPLFPTPENGPKSRHLQGVPQDLIFSLFFTIFNNFLTF